MSANTLIRQALQETPSTSVALSAKGEAVKTKAATASMEDVRFWGYVAIAEDPFSCWLWQAGKTSRGYGAYVFDCASDAAHRVSWQLVHGPIPQGMFVCHHCDIPLCVNPHHLFLGTPQENVDDRVKKQRGRFHSEAVIARAVEMLAAGSSQRSVARTLGIPQPSLSLILSRRRRQEAQVAANHSGDPSPAPEHFRSVAEKTLSPRIS